MSTFLFAFVVLAVSVLRSSKINYVFSATPSPLPGGAEEEIKIDYVLPYPGKILPDSPLWFLKVLRDKVWLTVTLNSSRKAELMLLMADKRLLSAKALFEKDKAGLAYSTLTKAEKYLEKAAGQEEKNRKGGADTKEFLDRLAKASLKHRQVIKEILAIAPEDARPGIITTENYAKNVYKNSRDALQSLGITPPKNPFNGE